MIAKNVPKVVKVVAILLIAALLLVACKKEASAAPAQIGEFGGPEVPTCHCTTVVITPTQPAGTYMIEAWGSGHWAKGVRNGTNTTLWGPTDFYATVTYFRWTGIALTAGETVQVQVSETGPNSGYTTTGCVEVVPAALEIDFDTWGAWIVPNGNEIYWTVISEYDARDYEIYRHLAANLPGMKIFTQPANAGATAGASYSYFDSTLTTHKARWYSIRAYSMLGHVTTYGPFRAVSPPLGE